MYNQIRTMTARQINRSRMMPELQRIVKEGARKTKSDEPKK